MKKLLLLLASGSIAVSAVAQQRTMDFVGPRMPEKIKYRDLQMNFLKSRGAAAKTTAAPRRWYNYVDFIDSYYDALTTQGARLSNIPIWSYDTLHKLTYSDGTVGNINFYSVATVLDPSSDTSFNNPDYYLGEMKISATESYRVDSVAIFGFYDRNPSSTTIVDTIRLSFLKGNGAASSSEDVFSGYSVVGGHYPGATFLAMRHDTVLNIAKGASGTTGTVSPSVYIQDVLLNAASLADTDANGMWFKVVPLTTPINVSANGFVGMAVSFMSGESTPAGSMVHNFQTGVTTQGLWRPTIGYASDLATPTDNPLWPYYTVADSNMGYTARNTGAIYPPAISWSTGGGSAPSAIQYPFVSWNLYCATCGNVPPRPTAGVATTELISKAQAYPNPAGNELTVPFSLVNTANVSVTLSNMLGQVVATRNMGNVANGTATFNTTSLPSGLYTYSVNANGQRTTGRVVIAH